MNRIIFSFLLMYLPLGLFAQTHLWVFLEDKGPEVVASLDVPVHETYLQELEQLGWSVVSTSRWLNAAVIEADGVDPDQIISLPFVTEIHPAARFERMQVAPSDIPAPEPEMATSFGRATFQNTLIEVEHLHQKGLLGQGQVMAVLDAGFLGVDTIAAFQRLREEGRILATKDFVEGDAHVFAHHDHGTEVLSTIAADLPEELVGTAPQISVLLARTEDARSETQIEEHNFVAALEWADSLGADMVHASLGYSRFRQGKGSYRHEELDGQTAITTRAVDIAASRGMLITVAAGNEGTSSWRKITVPCDADSVLCIGAIDRQRQRASYSSVGPTADGRIKPDVVAFGSGVAVARADNRLGSGRGTSLSSPIVAGMAACLWQAHPDAHSQLVIQAIKESSHQFPQPDNEYGYGIPNARLADSLLQLWQEKPVAEEIVEEALPMAPPATLEESYRLECKSWEESGILFRQKRNQLILTGTNLPQVAAQIAVYGPDGLLLPNQLTMRAKAKRIKLKWKEVPVGKYELIYSGEEGKFLFPFNLE
ncbi:MAG: S8 family serine peptidase [Bacteroidota bacterium]